MLKGTDGHSSVPSPRFTSEEPQCPHSVDTQLEGLLSAGGLHVAMPNNVDPQPVSDLPSLLEASNSSETNFNESSSGLASCWDHPSEAQKQINVNLAHSARQHCRSPLPHALSHTASRKGSETYAALQQRNLAKLHPEQQAVMQAYMLPTQSSLQHAHSLPSSPNVSCVSPNCRTHAC